MVDGVFHDAPDAVAALALTHGAGGNRDSALLVALAEGLARRRVSVLRYNLPFRVLRNQGPPNRAHAQHDREGIADAVTHLADLAGSVPIFMGGHSYGGRQSSILAAEQPHCASGLVLLSYPLHPPAKPDRLRTEHFPMVRMPSLFVHGDRDPFGSLEELNSAVPQLGGAAVVVPVEGARHDLGGAKSSATVQFIVDAIETHVVAR
ncbi:alpha/beta fold hydrolase [Hoyosella rhizosphaerae]|uniref:Alpha/beta hydrolase n=1 Tax=Hoyosella rhizosphaerae TaxID=1755582 RepID=A0A916XGB2_9ACTN|nr:alpha/beta fold hydrolase [Hoyosella rhizosphaerae]MBN4925519.1 alpha/beta fold hydrolase [Hoyosella rhizosphaerae]GGC69991.1 alpha/beta hydrolase [Hoyosella rhizosphaerae]